MTIVANEAYQAKSPDYKALLQRVKAENPEVVYFASYLLDAMTLMRQAEQVELSPKFLAAAGTGFSAAEFPTEKGAGKYAEYTFSVSQWLPSAKWAGSKQFDEAYVKRADSHPAYHGMQAYAALIVAADAIKNAGSEDPQEIADAIRKEYLETPFGPIAFDAKGQNAHPVLITQVQGGQYKVVWPPDQAEARSGPRRSGPNGSNRQVPRWRRSVPGAGGPERTADRLAVRADRHGHGADLRRDADRQLRAGAFMMSACTSRTCCRLAGRVAVPRLPRLGGGAVRPRDSAYQTCCAGSPSAPSSCRSC